MAERQYKWWQNKPGAQRHACLLESAAKRSDNKKSPQQAAGYWW
jgi:hypothetical protein